MKRCSPISRCASAAAARRGAICRGAAGEFPYSVVPAGRLGGGDSHLGASHPPPAGRTAASAVADVFPPPAGTHDVAPPFATSVVAGGAVPADSAAGAGFRASVLSLDDERDGRR